MTTLILLGASVRAAAFSAIRAGFSPYAIDLFADRDLAAACPAVKIRRYPREFMTALAAAPDAPWIYTGGLENHPRLVDRLADMRPLLGNHGSVLRKVRDPWRLASVVQSAGLRFPNMSQASSGANVAEKWLVKPRRGSGGLGIRFASTDDLAQPPRGFYLQEHIPGEAASAVFVAGGGRAIFIGATRQLLGRDLSLKRPFLFAGSVGPLTMRKSEVEPLKQLGDALARAFGLIGLFNVDWVRTDDGLWPVEVNPRYSASVEVLERALGIHCVAMHVAACYGEAATPMACTGETPAEKVCGKAIVYAREDSVVTARFEALVDEWNRPGAWPLIADLPGIGESISAGQPVATVFAAGDMLAAVERGLAARIAAVHSAL